MAGAPAGVPPLAPRHRALRRDYFPLLPGELLGEPPLLLAPEPPEPLRLVPLEVPEAPLEPDGPQSIALLLPLLAMFGLPLEDGLLFGEVAERPAPPLLALELLLGLLPGRQSLLLAPERTEPLVPLGLDELGLDAPGLDELGLEAPLPLAPPEPELPDCANAWPPSRTTAAPTSAK